VSDHGLTAAGADAGHPGPPGAGSRWRVTWRRVLRNRPLRRLSLAFLVFHSAEYGEWIAVLVYAYSRGGAATAGVVAAVQLVPCGLLAPVLAGLADRMAPERLLRLAYLAQAGTMLVIAVAITAHAPPAVVYAAGTLAAIPFTIPRPVQAVVLPAVSVSATDLTAANVVSSWAESVGIVVGPAVTALLIGRTGSAGVLVFFAAAAIGACWLVPRLGPPVAAAAAAAAEAPEPEGPTIAASLGQTLRVVRRNPSVLVLLAGAFAHFVVFGALDVLYLVLAISLLHSGQPGVGYLNAAFGAGSVLSVVLTARLVGRLRFAPPMIIAAALWGAAFLLLATARTMLTAALLLAVAAMMSTVVEVCGKSLLQRVAPPELQASIFGLLEGASMAAFALGSLLVPALIWLLGDRGAVAAVGLILPVTVLGTLPWLRRVDQRATVPVVEISLLRRVPAFAALPPPEIEGLARMLQPVHAPAGRRIVRQGDAGDRLYVIADGTVTVTRDQAPLVTMGRGAMFGEIALLTGSPRSADVTAATDAELYALDQAPFIAALTSHAPARRIAHALAHRRMTEPGSA
jgi:Na+/melibiose symporter-like transporter